MTIDYALELNAAQFEAATTLSGSVLVIAGAGSGKTRTLVYRLANLVQSGIPASSILLLTFTRKAAQEMLERAHKLLTPDAHFGSMTSLNLAAVQGGTFHGFSYTTLRLFQPEGYALRLTVMDHHDMLASLQYCREALKAGKGDRSFPKNQTILSMLSKARNKEMDLENVLRKDAHHLLPHADVMHEMGDAYQIFKKEKGLLDYDDLLFALEEVLRTRPEALNFCRERYHYIMVDEYQDTNPVQARIVALIAGNETPCKGALPGHGNIMAVGDDAQSIYAFRGADVRNILRFPHIFPDTKIIRLEENYRSTQPILELTNGILSHATEGYSKHLFTLRQGGALPNVIRPISDRTQAGIVASRIVELLGRHPAHEIAVLFRSGFHSYHVEIQLNKLGIPFKKYGGIRYTDAAHIKDVMSFIRLVQNPLDYTAFSRMAEMSKGIGPKTCLKLYRLALAGDADALAKMLAKYDELAKDLALVDVLRCKEVSPSELLALIVDHYKTRLPAFYPDDHPRRLQGLEQLILIATSYSELDMFIADLSLDDPMQGSEEREAIVLSTIHSAKGLEWSAILILDLVEDRFPSRHSLLREDDFEEERRLMYVACTRAKEHLDLFVPASIYDRGSGGSIPATPSPFIRELPPSLYIEWQEGYTGGLTRREYTAPRSLPFARSCLAQHADIDDSIAHNLPPEEVTSEETHIKSSGFDVSQPDQLEASATVLPSQCGFCHHKVFGRGKIVQHLPPDKYRVNFPGLGLKVIIGAYLTMEK